MGFFDRFKTKESEVIVSDVDNKPKIVQEETQPQTNTVKRPIFRHGKFAQAKNNIIVNISGIEDVIKNTRQSPEIREGKEEKEIRVEQNIVEISKVLKDKYNIDTSSPQSVMETWHEEKMTCGRLWNFGLKKLGQNQNTTPKERKILVEKFTKDPECAEEYKKFLFHQERRYAIVSFIQSQDSDTKKRYLQYLPPAPIVKISFEMDYLLIHGSSHELMKEKKDSIEKKFGSMSSYKDIMNNPNLKNLTQEKAFTGEIIEMRFKPGSGGYLVGSFWDKTSGVALDFSANNDAMKFLTPMIKKMAEDKLIAPMDQNGAYYMSDRMENLKIWAVGKQIGDNLIFQKIKVDLNRKNREDVR